MFRDENQWFDGPASERRLHKLRPPARHKQAPPPPDAADKKTHHQTLWTLTREQIPFLPKSGECHSVYVSKTQNLLRILLSVADDQRNAP